MTTSEAPSSPSSQSPGALQRGKACIACRRRKVKCDGVRPICGQCIRGHRPDDCEYTDGQVKSRTHMLEEDIARLQARVRELEYPDHTTPAVALHNPYSLPGVSQGSSALFDFNVPSSTSPAPSPGAQDEPPIYVVLESLNQIYAYADEFGFFLHIPRVRALLLEATAGDGIPLALQNAINLIALHLTEGQQQSASELTLLSTSSRQLADIIPFCSASTRDLLHVIQTEVLLTFYLFRVGRTVEARYHLGAAASLALAFGLHSSSPEGDPHAPADIQSMLFDIFRTTLPHPVDEIERTEAIHAFWTIFTRDKCMSAVLGVPPAISRSVRITVPWPERVQEVNSFHQDVHLMNNRPGDKPQTDTIQEFLDGVSSDEGNPSSELALYAKSLVLFDKANNLVERYTSDPRIQETQSFGEEFALLDALIENLQAFITSSLRSTPTHPRHQFIPRFAIYTQSVVSLATIRLHSPFCESYASSNAKNVTAAMRIAHALQGMNLKTLQFVDPVILIWINASFVIHAEITRLRALKTNWETQFAVHGEEEFVHALKIILDVLRDMVDRCPVLVLRRKLEAVLPLLEYLGPSQ